MDDDGLMRRAAGGDTLAFGVLVRTYQARLVRFAARLTGDSDLAQDAVQEAFLRLWRGRATYEPRGCLQAYLFRAVRSGCLDYARTSRPTDALDENAEADAPGPAALDENAEADAPGPAALAEARSLADAVRFAVQSLPEMQRAVFILSEYEQISYAEIAGVLDCPVGTVASRKHQAVETLRRKLSSWKDLA